MHQPFKEALSVTAPYAKLNPLQQNFLLKCIIFFNICKQKAIKMHMRSLSCDLMCHKEKLHFFAPNNY